MTQHPERSGTFGDLEATPEHLVAEIINGELVTRSHGWMLPAMARTALSVKLGQLTQRCSNPDARWQVLPLPELHLGDGVLVPEIAAWRVEHLPFLPDENHMGLPPDWVCELVSKDDRTNPAIKPKLAIYAAFGVERAWIVDLSARQLRALVRSGRDWMLVAIFGANEQVSAPPFDAISFSLADLWPLDPPLGFNEDPTPYYAGDR